jgi:copper chaperone
MEKTTIKVSGMTCMGCVNSVKRVLTAVNGVRSVDVSLDEARATVEYDSAVANPAQLKSAIEGAGFTAS